MANSPGGKGSRRRREDQSKVLSNWDKIVWNHKPSSNTIVESTKDTKGISDK